MTKGGTVQGDNKVVPTTITTTEAEISYGGAADLWGLSLSSTEVNNSDFGFVYAGIRIATSEYLKSTNFGFSTSGTIDGVEAKIQIKVNGTQRSHMMDCMTLKVTFTAPEPDTNAIGNFQCISGKCEIKSGKLEVK